MSVLLIFILASMQCKICNWFFTILLDGRSTQTSTGSSVYVYDGLHKVLTLPATVLLAKTITVPLSKY